MKRLLLLVAILCTRPAFAAIACDATAHSGHTSLCENLAANKTTGAGWQTIVTPSFSTGAGPILLVAVVTADGGAAPFGAGSGLSNTSGLAWTNRKDETDTAHEYGAQVWTAFSATGSLTTQTVTFTAHASSGSQSGALWVIVLTGVPSTEAACIGAAGGFVDLTGVSLTLNATVNATAAGSWLVGGFGEANGTAGSLPADSNTTPFDVSITGGATIDANGFGRFKSGGTVTTTTGAGNVTFGSSTADDFGYSAALEVKVAAGVGGTALFPSQRTRRGH